jgi:hypothetical protein
MFGCTRWPDCPHPHRTLEVINGIGVPVMRCRLTGRHPDECALAAGSRRAKTPQTVECEASQSGPKGNAQ